MINELYIEYDGRIYPVIDSDADNYLVVSENDDVIWIPKSVCKIVN